MSTLLFSTAPDQREDQRGTGGVDQVPNINNIDPLIYPLVDAMNRSGRAITRASCQGHWDTWLGVSSPYVAFTADHAFAEALDQQIGVAYSDGLLANYWELSARFGLDRRLWFRLSSRSDLVRDAMRWTLRPRRIWSEYVARKQADVDAIIHCVDLAARIGPSRFAG